MKKLLTFTVLFAVGVASAASIDWKLSTGGSSNYMVGKDGNALTGTAYLLLASDVTDFASEDEIAAAALGSASITSGVNKDTQTATSSKLTAPQAYDFTVLVYDSASDTYFTSAATKNQQTYNFGADMDNYGTATSISFTANNLYATSTLRGTQEWTSPGGSGQQGEDVPEPATGALALAGVALLFKRRRA